MIRVDTFPTHEYKGTKLRVGKPLLHGATTVPGGVNFTVFSRHAYSCTLVLFHKGEKRPFAEIPFFQEFQIGNVYSMIVFDLDYEDLEYGYRFDGPHNFSEGHLFDNSKILMDPFAKLIGGRDVWGEVPDWKDPYQHRARIAFDDFDWGDDKPLEVPMEDLIIYEMHVRSFTRHSSSGVKHPGTFAGLREKIPYLKELGINCVELMPIHEFDEFENSRKSPVTGETLYNYWGYSNVGFYAPKAGYAATGKYGMQIDELKNMIKELHANGIEVLLDVVFNHTAEGNENGPYISYRGIDNKTYYMLTPEGYYYNFSGCGNTLNCNNPVVRQMILDCLRYWAAEYHVDGFRFDLASILGRDPFGAPMSNPPLLETLAYDPVLGKCKLIAEAWDAGGLYQVGSFPAFGRWAEWNGKFRDDVRRFVKGDAGILPALGQRVQGSPDLYAHLNRGAAASVNFVTAHDGFTMMDLVSFNEKHNEANGEENRDGGNDNFSWNCGVEGFTDEPDIVSLRKKQIKNFFTILMVSQGIPMVLAGDEFGNSQKGNNNAYCQDNEISWLDWGLVKQNADLFHFAKGVIALRKNHAAFRNKYHFQNKDYMGSGWADITWHGNKAWWADWSENSRMLAFLLCGKHAKQGLVQDDLIYVAMNMDWQMHGFTVPGLGDDMSWYIAVNTDLPSGKDVYPKGKEVLLENQQEILVGPRSIAVLIGK
ncbi:MAG: glycogen debranching protein GlgX [Spirochaetia bacterium]